MIPRAVISSDIRRRLDKAGIDQVLASLYPVDCQTCGQSLGREVPVLRVVEGVGFAGASLHHRHCKSSEWQDLNDTKTGISVLTGPFTATLTFRTRTLVLPVHLDGPDGEREEVPLMVVNPGLETVNLVPDDTGRWRVGHAGWYHSAGLVPPGEQLSLTEPAPGASATLTPGEVCVRVQGATEGPFTASVPDGFDANARERGGVLLAVTHAIDPAAITDMRDLQPVLRGDRTLMGLAALQR